jgi:MYXO-CTERM domain-containing protein
MLERGSSRSFPVGGADERRLVAALAVFAGSLLGAAEAQAFCRTTTCDPEVESCIPDANGCIPTGLPLYWPERHIHFGVQKDGSPRRRITYEAANEVISASYRTWRSVECAGRAPSFEIWDLGAPFGGIECDEPEFNQSEPNANVWIFRDDDWPYAGGSSTLALTTITFEVPTGAILDADVEVNTFTINITVGDRVIDNDLLSIATHETGHFLGLSHTNVQAATMFAHYSPGDIEFRTLHPDDVAGICDIYPPDRETSGGDGPRPRHGFSRYCAEPTQRSRGCSLASSSGETSRSRPWSEGVGIALLGLAAAGLVRRRRR